MLLIYTSVLLLVSSLTLSLRLHAQVDMQPLPTPDWWVSYSFIDGDEFVMATRDSLYLSRDNGSSWTVVSPPAVAGSIAHWDWIAQGRGLLMFIDEGAAHFITLAWTDDYGATWDLYAFPQSERMTVHPQAAVTGLTRLTDSTMLCAIQNRLFRSSDRGVSFEELSTPMIPFSFHRFAEGSAWLVGSMTGMLGMTTDAGSSWSLRALPGSINRVTVDGMARTIVTASTSARSVFITDPGGTDFRTVSMPDDDFFGGVDAAHTRLVLLDERNLALFVRHAWSGRQRVYRTSDAGVHWYWIALDQPVQDAWPISASEMLLLGGDARLYALRFLPVAGFSILSSDYSAFDAPATLLTWSDPVEGRWQYADVERATADSVWTQLARVFAPDRYYLDQILTGSETLRYRVTLSHDAGVVREYTEAVSPGVARYFNLASFVFPGNAASLTYRHRRIVMLDSDVQSDSAVVLRYDFMPPLDSTRWLRMRNLEKTVYDGSGGVSSSRERIIEYRGEQPRFAFDNSGSASSFGYIGLGRAIEFRDAGGVSVGSMHTPFPGFAESAFVADIAADTLRFTGVNPDPFGEQTEILITAVRGVGIVSAVGVTQSRRFSFHDTLILLDAVRGIGEAGLPASVRVLGNHPNPFSIGSTIRYTLGSASHVSLSIHDQLGRRVAMLVDDWRDAGEHSIYFNAAALQPGVYHCRLRMGPQSSTWMMMLVR
jgi:hypothetical protein